MEREELVGDFRDDEATPFRALIQTSETTLQAVVELTEGLEAGTSALAHQ